MELPDDTLALYWNAKILANGSRLGNRLRSQLTPFSCVHVFSAWPELPFKFIPCKAMPLGKCLAEKTGQHTHGDTYSTDGSNGFEMAVNVLELD